MPNAAAHRKNAMTGLKRLRERAAKSRQVEQQVSAGRVLAILLVIVAGYDIVSTNAALAVGHMEGNPVIQSLQDQLGSWWSLPKVGVHLVLAMLILWLPSKRMLSVARFVIFMYALIVVNNLYLAGIVP